jgi:glycosyltransferase involved in cell wall biosynthesis
MSARQRRRVLLLVTSMARGGAERQVVDLAVSLRTRGWEVTVVSMVAPTDHQSELLSGKVALVSLDMTRGRPSIRAMALYLRIVRRWRPDVIHAHMVHANLLARVGRILVPSVPVISTIHNVNEGRRWREMAYRVSDLLSSATTAVSRAAAERYVAVGAVPSGRVTVIPNGFNLERTADPSRRDAIRRELRVGQDSFVWLTIGRLVEAKGHDLLVEAFRSVVDAFGGTRLVIAGDGEERIRLQQLIRDLRLEGQVSMLGERRDAQSLLTAADAFVLSSRWEGLPMVLLEAAAQGVPIVSTDVGGCGEIAVPELGAVLTEPHPAALASGMKALMARSSRDREEIGRHLRRHVETEYELSSVVDRWEALYLSLINGAGVR